MSGHAKCRTYVILHGGVVAFCLSRVTLMSTLRDTECCNCLLDDVKGLVSGTYYLLHNMSFGVLPGIHVDCLREFTMWL